jgi:hypothetical protein
MRRHLGRALALPCVLALGLLAGTAAAYELSWWTVDAGGSNHSPGTRHALGGTLGQPDAGSGSGSRYSLEGGFWGGIRARREQQGAATATPTPTVPGGKTATPTPTVPGGKTATPTPTVPGGKTATPTPTVPGGKTATPTPTGSPPPRPPQVPASSAPGQGSMLLLLLAAALFTLRRSRARKPGA